MFLRCWNLVTNHWISTKLRQIKQYTQTKNALKTTWTFRISPISFISIMTGCLIYVRFTSAVCPLTGAMVSHELRLSFTFSVEMCEFVWFRLFHSSTLIKPQLPLLSLHATQNLLSLITLAYIYLVRSGDAHIPNIHWTILHSWLAYASNTTPIRPTTLVVIYVWNLTNI